MTLEQIKANWTETDKIIYQLQSLEAAKTKVIAQN